MQPATTTFGRYRLLRPIGRGGMGAVYEAEHLHLGKRVALKTLPGAAVGDARAIERFLREGRAAARVRHPHVVDVTDVGVEGGVPYLVMELLEGEDLAARLRRGPLDVAEALDLLLPVVAAVDAMHRVGVLHRDLKPENIFLARELGRVVPRVLDFGVSRPDVPEPGAPSARSGLVGTPYYLSPEQVDGARGDARSDQHALAVIAYECLGGARPYEAPTLLELLSRIRDGRRGDLRDRRPDLPAALADAIDRAMSPSPAARFESVRAFGDALARGPSARAAAAWRELTAAPPAAPDAAAPAPDAAAPAAVTRRDGSPAAPAPGDVSWEPAPPGAPRARRPLALAALLALLAAGAALRWAVREPAPGPRPRPRAAPAVGTPSAPVAQVAVDASVAPAPLDPPRPSPRATPPPRRTPRAVAPPALPPPPVATPVAPASAVATPPAPERPIVNGAPIVD